MSNLEAKQYIDDVTPSINYLFDGIERYHRMDFDPENIESCEYWRHRHARDELCGSLITIVARFFRILDTKGELSTQERLIQDHIKTGKPGVNPIYCWGREITGLHLGTIIHFSRNRAAHYEDGLNPNSTRVARFIWEHIEKHSTENYPEVQYVDAIRRTIYGVGWMSANILGFIGWNKGLSIDRKLFFKDIDVTLKSAV